MKKHTELLLIVIHSIVFVFLFFKQYVGLNLFVFELLTIASLLFVLKIKPLSPVSKIVLAGTLLSGLAVVINFSIIAILINISSFYLFTGTMVYPKVHSILSAALLSISNSFQSFGLFFHLLGSLKSNNRGIKWIFSFVKIALLPIIIIIVFIVIYDASNPIFSKGISLIGTYLDPLFNNFFKNFNVDFFITLGFGFIVSIITFLKVKNMWLINYDINIPETMHRLRQKNQNKFFKPTGLKNELQSAIFLLASLNILILIVNIIDIYWVWFNFEWQGEYLKQFVHEGTYLLILSIIISIALVLFFFRRNLNFYINNKNLKLLAYVWLAQNAILAVSVAIRNFWYINYFALAYKRIGVIVFLIITLYGIYTVFEKVRNKKTTFYLFRTNFLAIYCMLVFLTLFNWDAIIARYNFKHYQKSFVHLNFLSTLSYKALPQLDKSMDELIKINKIQRQIFPFEQEYMSVEEYHSIIEEKKTEFITKWEEKNIKSWNLAEWNAYNKLKK